MGTRVAVLALAALLSVAIAAEARAAVDPRGAAPGSPNPLVGLRWFVDTETHPSAVNYRQWRSSRPADAAQVLKIAREPQFRWFGTWNRNVFRDLRAYLRLRTRLSPGSVPALTVYRHLRPGNAVPDSNGRSAHDGRAYSFSRRQYRRWIRWIRWFARAVGRRRVVIAYEPDSLGSMKYLSRGARRARLRTLRKGISILSKLPRATIYIEGGASDWRPYTETVRQLRYVGINRVRGFMLNATHFDWTDANIAHGLKISRALGGKPFVISTHGNGRGPLHYYRVIGGRTRRVNVWCNPPNSGLGPRPTTSTANARVDAYLWIGRAGYSGGRCNGGPKAGYWWPARGLAMARRAPY
jgi:endoglucanase